MKYSAYYVLQITSIITFIPHIILAFFLLGGSPLTPTTIDQAWVYIGLMALISTVLYISAYIALSLFKKIITSSQLFLISSLFFSSLLPSLQIFIIRFEYAINNEVLTILVRTFNFLYILTILLIVFSLINTNRRSNRNLLLLFLLTSLSLWLTNAGLLSFSKPDSTADIFMGEEFVLIGAGLSLILISIGIYIINLIELKLRYTLIISRCVYLLGFLLSLHFLLLYALFSAILSIIVIIILGLCVLGYLRNSFIHAF